jgi:hypothetical protein
MFLPGIIPELPPPFDPTTLLIDIVGFIAQLFGLGGNQLKAVNEAIKTTWTNLVLTTGFLYNAVRSVLGFLQKLLKIIVDGLKHVISDVLHGHLLAVLKDLQAMFHAIHDLFAPILKFIAQVQAWYIKYIYRYVKMVEDIISRIRVVLSLFRLLGIKWAAKLDADLARIQGYLTTALQAIVGTLNTVSTWLTLITDPAGIIRKDFFTGTLFSSLGPVRSAMTFGQDRALFASEASNTAGDRGMIDGGAAILTRNKDGSVSYSDASKRINSGYDAAWSYYGP